MSHHEEKTNRQGANEKAKSQPKEAGKNANQPGQPGRPNPNANPNREQGINPRESGSGIPAQVRESDRNRDR